jgi:hypothetical protein
MNLNPADPPYTNATDAVLFETRRDVVQQLIPLFLDAPAGSSR